MNNCILLLGLLVANNSFYILLPINWAHAKRYMTLIINPYTGLSKPCNKKNYKFYNAKQLTHRINEKNPSEFGILITRNHLNIKICCMYLKKHHLVKNY